MPFIGRKKIFLLGVISNYGANIVAIIVGLISVPIGLHYFGITRYGIWAIISSIIAYLNTSNLGITTAAATLTAGATKSSAQRIILHRSSFLLAISASVALIIVCGVSHFYSSWVLILGKIPIGLKKEATVAALSAAVLFLFNLPITIFSSGFIGLQEFYWNRFYSSITSVLGLLALILTVLLKGNLITLALFRGVATIFVSIGCGIHFFFAHPELSKKTERGLNETFSNKTIFVSGIRFFAIGIAAMVVWNTDNLVISHFIGPAAVTPYAITFKLFAIVFAMFTAINSTLFPMIGKAAGLNQWNWIQGIYQNTTQLSPIIGGVIWIGGIVFVKNIIYIWAGPSAYGGILVVFALGGYGYLLSIVNINAFLLTGLNTTKNMVFIGWAEAIANIVISIALVGSLGIGGVALGTFLASLLTVFWMLPVDVYKQTQGRIKINSKFIIKHFLFAAVPSLVGVILLQYYIKSATGVLFAGSAIILVYLYLSWRFISNSLQKSIINQFKIVMQRIGVNG